MTDDSATPAPTGPGGDRSWRIPLLAGAVVLVIVAGVTALVAGSGDDDPQDASSDPTSGSSTASASPSASESATGSPSASASASASASPTDAPTTPEGDPVISPIINKAARAAVKDDFPALVPSGVPAGWTVLSAGYSPKQGGRWTIELTNAAGGSVRLVQTAQDVDELVADTLAMDMQQPTGTVNLGAYGTGRWTVYAGSGATAIVTDIADTAALVVGPDEDTVVALAQQLLTAEDADLPEAG